jgi:hypothetical protein
MRRLLCKLFGHSWDYSFDRPRITTCRRCHFQRPVISFGTFAAFAGLDRVSIVERAPSGEFAYLTPYEAGKK